LSLQDDHARTAPFGDFPSLGQQQPADPATPVSGLDEKLPDAQAPGPRFVSDFDPSHGRVADARGEDPRLLEARLEQGALRRLGDRVGKGLVHEAQAPPSAVTPAVHAIMARGDVGIAKAREIFGARQDFLDPRVARRHG